MNLLHSIFRTGKIVALAFTGWLLTSSILFAKEGTPAEGGGGQGSWVISYSILLLGLVLGMLPVCRSSTRRERVRPESYAEGKISHSSTDED